MATAGGPAQARAAKLLDVGRALSERLGHPHAIGWSRLAAGFAAFLSGRLARERARGCSPRRRSIFRERCSGCCLAELEARSDLFSLWTRYYLGEAGELRRLLPSRVLEASARGDRYGVTNLRARIAHVIALGDDDPAAGEREAKEAVASWSHQGFHAQHYYQLFAQAEADLYRGDAMAAADVVDTRWPALHRSLLLQVQFIRLEALHLRARTHLAAARTGGGVTGGQVVQAALDDAKRIERAGMAWALPLGGLVRAGAAALLGDAARAASLCEGAAHQLERGGDVAVPRRWRAGGSGSSSAAARGTRW